MTQITIYNNLSECFNTIEEPDWYSEAVNFLRGGKDKGKFGIYLYNLIKKNDHIHKIINIGTARGYSAVCAAKALNDVNRDGTIHTIDIIPSEESRTWDANSPNDPVRDIKGKITIREFVEKFCTKKEEMLIKFYTGRSSDVLKELDINPDLVFHDGKHTYEVVRTDMKLVRKMSNGSLIQVHDDCHLFNVDSEWSFHNPVNGTKLGDFPILRRSDFIQNLNHHQYSLIKRKFPGVRSAVQEYIHKIEYDNIDIICDEDHSPITTIWE